MKSRVFLGIMIMTLVRTCLATLIWLLTVNWPDLFYSGGNGDIGKSYKGPSHVLNGLYVFY